MTYNVFSGTLNPTHSTLPFIPFIQNSLRLRETVCFASCSILKSIWQMRKQNNCLYTMVTLHCCKSYFSENGYNSISNCEATLSCLYQTLMFHAHEVTPSRIARFRH